MQICICNLLLCSKKIIRGFIVKKKLKQILAFIVFFLTISFYSCNNLIEEHVHSYSVDWTYDDNYHWHAATCEHSDQVVDKQFHLYHIKAEGESSSIYVYGHHIYLCNNQDWDKNTKKSWIKFYLNEDKGSKVTFEKTVDGGFQWYATTPAKEKAKEYDGRTAAFFDLESFVFYEDGNKFVIEIQ